MPKLDIVLSIVSVAANVIWMTDLVPCVQPSNNVTYKLLFSVSCHWLNSSLNLEVVLIPLIFSS